MKKILSCLMRRRGVLNFCTTSTLIIMTLSCILEIHQYFFGKFAVPILITVPILIHCFVSCNVPANYGAVFHPYQRHNFSHGIHATGPGKEKTSVAESKALLRLLTNFTSEYIAYDKLFSQSDSWKTCFHPQLDPFGDFW